MLGRTDSRGRLLLLMAMLTVLSGGLMLRLAYWQIGQRQQLATLVSDNSALTETVPSVRGTIYDRTGKVVLAQTVFFDRLVAAPAELTAKQRDEVTATLTGILGVSGSDAAALKSAMNVNTHYVVLASDLDRKTVAAIRSAMGDGDLPTIQLEPQAVRVYPQAGGAPHTTLAAQLIGFVNGNGEGQYGVEQYYNSVLAGRAVKRVTDPSLPPDQATQVVDPGVPGQDIRLTIDASLQLSLEQEVFAAWSADRAKRVSAVIMDPKTGELLAEASYPSYDANDYRAIASTNPAVFRDPVVSDVYEPGSVLKMLLASAALKNNSVTLSTKINDYGVMRLPGGLEVADADRRAKGWMQFQDIVAWSRNVGVTQVAFKLGKDVPTASSVLYKTWKDYGLGGPTGVDLAGEEPGIVRDPGKDPWRQIDLANGSFGQGVGTTQMQVLRAYTAMANGGYLVTPHVLKPADPPAGSAAASSTPSDAPSTTAPASGSAGASSTSGAKASASSSDSLSGAAAATPSGTRIIDSALSSKLTGLMAHVVSGVPFYAQRTLMPGYLVGGKTGTAQIWDPAANGGKGAWKDNVFNYSFYGYVGQNSPQLMVGVVINEGTPTYIAQGVLDMPVQSFELFRRIATDSVSTLGIPPVTGSGSQSSPNPGGTATPQG